MCGGGRWGVGIHTVQYCLSCWVKIVFLSQSNNNKRVDLLKHFSSMARWGDIDWARCLIFRCWGTQFVILTAIIYWLVGLFVARKSPWHSACNFLMGFVPLSLYGHHLWWWQVTGMKWFMFCSSLWNFEIWISALPQETPPFLCLHFCKMLFLIT